MIPKGDDRCPGWGPSLSDLGQYRLSRMPEGTERTRKQSNFSCFPFSFNYEMLQIILELANQLF